MSNEIIPNYQLKGVGLRCRCSVLFLILMNHWPNFSNSNFHSKNIVSTCSNRKAIGSLRLLKSIFYYIRGLLNNPYMQNDQLFKIYLKFAILSIFQYQKELGVKQQIAIGPTERLLSQLWNRWFFLLFSCRIQLYHVTSYITVNK